MRQIPGVWGLAPKHRPNQRPMCSFFRFTSLLFASPVSTTYAEPIQIGVEFTGANAANTANGWRNVNAPTTGSSLNAFGIYNNAGSGVFAAFFAFGTPPGSSPSRMMVNVNGTLVPAPGAIALLGLAGLVGRRRR